MSIYLNQNSQNFGILQNEPPLWFINKKHINPIDKLGINYYI